MVRSEVTKPSLSPYLSMTYETRLNLFKAAVARLVLPTGVTEIVFNDGGTNDYQVFAQLDTSKLENLRGIARKVKNLLDTIDGVRTYAHYSPVMEYSGYKDNEGKKVPIGYDREYITINLYYYPEE